jgi:TatD DNase family protein
VLTTSPSHMFLDSHCHLTAPQLAPDFEEVLNRALQSGVTEFLNIGDNLESSAEAIKQAELAQRLGTTMWATAGVHPQHALEYSFDTKDGTAQALRSLASHPRVRAIGEIGLDFVYDETHAQYPGASRDVQERVFRAQLELAAELQLPVVIHNREADERLMSVIADYRDVSPGGVFHCFGSAVEVAQRVLDLGFYLGFTGLVTFKNAAEVREAVKLCPLDRLLIETDSPYLAPVPHRGKTNEPSYLPPVAETIASLHNISTEELGRITTQNAIRLFHLDVSY